MRYEKLINTFLNIEEKLNLNLFCGIIYLQTRFFLFRKLQNIELLSKNKNSRIIKIDLNFLQFEFNSFLALLVKLPFFIAYKNVNFFSEHARYQKLNGLYVEPYSFLSQKNTIEKNNPIVRVGTIKNGFADIKFLDFKYLFISQYQFYFFSILLGALLVPVVFILYIYMYFYLKQFFPKKIFGYGFFFKLLYYCGSNIVALLLFFLIKPQKVNVTEAYNSNSCFIVAANILKIDSFEYQHGMISESHIGYNVKYSDQRVNNIYLPTYIYAWSEDWKEYIDIAKNKNTTIINWTYEYFYDYISKNNPQIKKSIDILVIGQPSISEELQKTTEEIAKVLKASRIVYKLHPKEILKNQFNSSNIIVKTDNLYELVIKSDLIIGGFSTALLEAQALNCKVYSLTKFVPSEYAKVLQYFSIILVEDWSEILNYSAANTLNTTTPINLNIEGLNCSITS